MTTEEIEKFYLRECRDYAPFVHRHVEYINRRIHYSYFNNIIKRATDSDELMFNTKGQILASVMVLCII